MNWDDLRYFLATLRAGSTAGAARQLHVRHTTVGRRLAALEEALGARLFTRDRAGMTPTDAGLELLPLAEEIERRAADIARLAEGSDRRIEGTVRVTCSEAFTGYLFGRLPRLGARHPGLAVEVLAGNRAYDIESGEAEIAIRMVPTDQPRLICQKLLEAGWSLYATRSYLASAGCPAGIEDLCGHRVIGFDRSMAGTPGAKWLAEHLPGIHPTLVANSVGALVQAVDAGAGVAMMPCFLEEGRPHLVRLFPEVVATREIWLVFRPDAGRIARVRAVIDFLAETIRADRALMSGRPQDPAP